MVISADGTVLEDHPGTISLGYSEHHSVGRVAFEYIHPDDQGRVAEKFVESERHLREAMALAGVGTWRRDVTTGDDACSEELCRMLGCEPATCTLTGSLELREAIDNGSDRALFWAAIDDLRAPGDIREGEFRVVRPDGELRIFHGRTTALGVEGEVTAVLATFQDVTNGSPPRPEPRAPERWQSPPVARPADSRPPPTAASLRRHLGRRAHLPLPAHSRRLPGGATSAGPTLCMAPD